MHRTREKRSFTLSEQALAVLTDYQREAKAASLSAALEQLIHAHQQRRQLDALDATVAAYYDNCPPEELAEQQAWGAFASSQLHSASQDKANEP